MNPTESSAQQIAASAPKRAMSTYQLLDLIRRRLPMYVGEASLQNLRSFLGGYTFCEWQAGIVIQEEALDFGGFHDWVANKLGYRESTSGWQNMIANQRIDAEEAVWLFFQLLDEYRGLYPRILASVALEEIYHIPQPSKRIQPAYTSLTIEEVLPAKEWVVLTARRHDAILYQLGTDTVEKAIQEAQRIFGLPPNIWMLAKT